MHRLLITAIASAALITAANGQDVKDLKAGELGAEYANLKAFVGTWELTAEGVKEKGKAEIRSILGGRFITEDVSVPFGGFQMEWHGVLSYDRVKKQYTGIWFDNLGNTTKSVSGEADQAGGVISFRGEHAGNARFLWRISTDGTKTMTIEMFSVAKDGKETRVMKVRGEKQK
jgi:hypothetical protein